MTAGDFLRQVPLFAGLSPSDLESLGALVRPDRYAAGEVIFHEGDEGTALYIIEKGEVKIVRGSAEGKEVVLSPPLGPGDFFGELALFDGEPRSADAVAKEASELLILRRSDFRRFVAGHPQMAVNLLEVLSRRLRRTDELVADAAFLDVRARLVKRLLDLADGQGQAGPEGVVIVSKLTQSHLASMVGTTRESINKALQYYIKKGWLRHERGRLTLLDIARLREDVF
jgi:CRP/FNR family transcriptional regulator, cyclic AMP receptor protein